MKFRKLFWTRRALHKLDSIGAKIYSDNPDASERVTKRIVQSADVLLEYPEIGRVGRIEKTRELVLSDIPYILPYKITENYISILTILHTAQKWPNTF